MRVAHQRPAPEPGSPCTGRKGTDDGAAGGIEVLPFGALIFVAGTLLIANAWAVVDAKLAVSAAAREAGRAYVEAPDEERARGAAQRAAALAMAGAGRDPAGLGLRDNDPPFVRCAVVEHEATYRVPAISIPLIGGFGRSITVHGRHRELLDPYRAGIGPGGGCGR